MIDQFFVDVTKALSNAGISEEECPVLARRFVSEIETALVRPEALAARLIALKGRLRDVLAAAVGGPVDRILITPVPDYIAPVLPGILSEFPAVVLADNFKAGTTIAGQNCVSLDDALVGIRSIDACLLGTVDQRLGRLFRDRLPAVRTVAAAELFFADSENASRPIAPGLAGFAADLASAPRPLLILAAYLDATLLPTLDALKSRGFNVFVATRRTFSKVETHAISDPTAIVEDRHLAVDLTEMLWLLRQTEGCPVIINYARFFASLWDLRNTIPLFAYSLAVLNAVSGPRILHLYDAYQVCLHGLEHEASSFVLYRTLLDFADGILVNSSAAPMLQGLLGSKKPIIGFLRYGPDVELTPEPEPGRFKIAMITNFIGEVDDPTRMTSDAVRGLLRQGIEVHYYSSASTVHRFKNELPTQERDFFHYHDAVRDQRSLVTEIGRYDAGWIVADMSCCDAPGEIFETEFARILAKGFVPTAVATAGILYGCAGLPTFFNKGNHGASMFPEGAAIEISLAEIAEITSVIDRTDWIRLRREMKEVRKMFTASFHIRRLSDWLEQFYNIADRTPSPVVND